jgi:hypothetical protein
MIKPTEAVSHSFLFTTHDKFLRLSLQVKEYVARFYSVKITPFWNIALCSLIEEDWVRLHDAVSQKAVTFILTAVRT